MRHKDLAALDSHSPSLELVENNTGVDIAALRCINHVATGTTYPQITLAVPGGEVHGITTDIIATGSTGYIFVYGFLWNLNTAAWAPGTLLYCGAGGVLSAVLAGGAVAKVFKQHATAGVIQVLTLQATTTIVGGGDVFGPAGATDHALCRFDLATGKLIQNSLGILDDLGALSGLISLTMDNGVTDGGAVYFNGGAASFLKSSADGLTLNVGGFSAVESVTGISFQADPLAPSTAIAGLDLDITGYACLYAQANAGVSGISVAHELAATLGALGTEVGQLTLTGYGSDVALETAPLVGINANKAGAGALSVRPVLGVFNNGSRLLDFGPTNSIQAAADIVLENQKGVRFSEAIAGGANYAKLIAADAMAGNVTWKLPNADGAINQVLKTDGSGNLGWVDSDFANREIVVSSGGVAEINAAITTMNGLGGGTVRLDGMFAMDGDIDMLSNVTLKGYGPGTGLVNSTANTYYIYFKGAVPTSYDIAAPVLNDDFFTCDTVGEAVNFVAGTVALLEDDNATFDETQLVYVKVTGNAGTGKVEIYDNIGGIPAVGWSATAVALPLTFAHAGLADMDVLNTSTGWIIPTIQYAYDIRFENVLFSECVQDLDECGAIVYKGCRFYSSNSLNLTQHVRLGGWTDTVDFVECGFRGAITGILWSANNKAIRRFSVRDCHFSGCAWCINLSPAAATTTSIDGILITGTVFDLLENPASGGGSPVCIYSGTVLLRNMVFTGNDLVRCRTTCMHLSASGASCPQNFTISGNKFGNKDVYLYGASDGVISGNESEGELILIDGSDQITVTGNSFNGMFVLVTAGGLGYAKRCTFTGNRFSGNVSFDPDVTGEYIKECTFTGNTCDSTVYFMNDTYEIAIAGNTFLGHVVIGAAPGDLNDKMTITGNHFHGNLTFTDPAQDDCVISDNVIEGTLTALTGTGNVVIDNSGSSLPTDLSLQNQAGIKFYEAIGGGSNYAKLQAPAALGGDYTLTLPPDDGVTGQFLQTDGSGVTTWADAVAAGREIIVPSGSGSAAVNAAIVALNALGGGSVRLDGVIAMDGNINMLPNVLLRGYGPGTGLSNNTANAYAVNFVGAAPTTYQIAAPVNGNDYFTCDTVGEAVNFVAGTMAIIEDDVTSLDQLQLVSIKTTGNGGTGKVEIFGAFQTPASALTWNAATVALPLTFKLAGLADMDVQSVGAGSIKIDIQYAHTLRFLGVRFEECVVEMDDCGDIDFDRCSFASKDSLALPRHVALSNWVDLVNFSECDLTGALAAIEWMGAKAIRRLAVYDCVISGCTTALNFNPTTPGSTSAAFITITDNVMTCLEAPGSGGGGGSGIVTAATLFDTFVISGNDIKCLSTGGYSINFGGTYPAKACNGTINGNFLGGEVLTSAASELTFVGNSCASSLDFTKGPYSIVVDGNKCNNIYFRATSIYINYCVVINNECAGGIFFYTGNVASTSCVCSNNRSASAIYVEGNLSYSVFANNRLELYMSFGTTGASVNKNLIVTGNYVKTDLTWSNVANTDCVIVGNYVGGTQTLPTGARCIVESAQLMKSTGARIVGVTTVNAATYDVLATDHVLHVTYTPTGTVAIRLMTAGMLAGRIVRVKDAGGNAAANPITISTEGAELIDGAADYTIGADYNSVDLYSDGSHWFVI